MGAVSGAVSGAGQRGSGDDDHADTYPPVCRRIWLSNHLYDHGGNPGRWKILICGVKERFDRAETSLSQGQKILTLPMVGVSGSSGVRMRRF